MLHEVKILSIYFNLILKGVKKYEVRFNDRNYQVGDEIKLQEWLPPTQDRPGRYTGQYLTMRITYIFADVTYLQPGYVILSIEF